MSKIWRGIEADQGVKDEWLERLYSIPGIAVYSGATYPGFTFTLYPWPDRSELHSLSRELEDVYAGVAHVHSVNRGAFPIFALTPLEGAFRLEWWDEVIERLEEFASRRPVTPPTIDDFERDILLGASEVFAFKQKSWPRERYTAHPRELSTPASEEEARRFLEELADLNRTSVYDLYRDDLEAVRGIDVPLNRFQFGHDAALRGLGIWNKSTPPPTVDYRVPVWWSVAPGAFDICVLKFPHIEGYDQYAILIEHPESSTSAKINLDPNPNSSQDFLDFRHGCEVLRFPSEQRQAFQDTNDRLKGSKLVCHAMPGKDIPDFIAGFFPRGDKDKAASAMERVLASCFARDR